MNTRSRQPANAAAGLIAATWLCACGTLPDDSGLDTAALERQALSALQTGDERTAANLYTQLANVSSGIRQTGFLLEAARLEVTLNNLLTARELLARAQPNAAGEQREMLQLLLARLELAEGRPSEALNRSRTLLDTTDTQLRAAALEVTGLAQFALGDPVAAIRDLSEREVWLDDINEIRANQQTLWINLFSVSAATQATGDAIVDGWLALAPIARITDSQEQRSALLQWRIGNLQHPAARVLITDLMPPENSGAPRQVALLLPISSAAREEARAIRDGFIAAHMQASQEFSFGRSAAAATNELSVRVYDTGVEGAESAYLRAEIEGADFIVGPLFRNYVELVLPQSGLTPTLVLNHTLSDEEVFGNTYQFALAPEDEAVAVARRAIALGQRRAVVLLPSNERGYRIFNRFQEEYELLGGEVLASMGYLGAISAYSNDIGMLLNLDRSNSRERTLQANLGEEIEFTPRRRQDIDMVFLIANPADGRQLAPQLEYLYAGDIPTYATSEIHDLNARSRESDLNRVTFPEVPWLIAPDAETLRLQQTIDARWPDRSIPMARFFGMGIDSYRIMNTLYADPFFTSVNGSTGELRMDPQGRIHRDLPFAQFRGGVVQPLEDPQPLQAGVIIGDGFEPGPMPPQTGDANTAPPIAVEPIVPDSMAPEATTPEPIESGFPARVPASDDVGR